MSIITKTAAILLFAILLLASSERAQSLSRPLASVTLAGSAEALSVKDRAEIFEDVWETVNEKYYDPSFNGVDWRAIRTRYRPLIDQTDDDRVFYRLLKRMVGELRDAHTRFHTPDERRERERFQAVSAGVSIFEVEGKPVAVAVEPDSDASRAGVEPGMIVVTIDGKPVAERLTEARSRVAGSSSERAVQLRVYRMIIDGDPGTILRMTLAQANGSLLEVSLTRRIVPDTAIVTSRRLQSGLGYLRLTLWRSPIRKQFEESLQQFRGAPGVIVDLRGNPGGEAEEVVKIASFFYDSHVPFGKFSTRSGRALYLRTDDDDQVYSGPVAILVNDGSGSGSELFAGVMQESGRAIVIGRRTCGCVRGISRFRRVKGGGEIAVSEYSYHSPDGKTFEGTGVVPNKEVALTINDLQQRRDPALEEAERLLLARMNRALR